MSPCRPPLSRRAAADDRPDGRRHTVDAKSEGGSWLRAMAAEQRVYFSVAGGKANAADRRTRAEQRLHRLGRTELGPVRIHARANGKRQRRAAVAVGHINW